MGDEGELIAASDYAQMLKDIDGVDTSQNSSANTSVSTPKAAPTTPANTSQIEKFVAQGDDEADEDDVLALRQLRQDRSSIFYKRGDEMDPQDDFNLK